MSANSFESGYSSNGEQGSHGRPEPNLVRIRADQKRLDEEFTITNLLMNSANGRIYEGEIKRTRENVILKQIPRDLVTSWASLDGHIVPSEIFYHFKAASYDNQDCIVRPLTWLEKNSSFVLVMEKMSNCSDVFELIKNHGPLHPSAALVIMRQLAQIVECLDRADICHRDLKDENLIIDRVTLKVKLIDFGCATDTDSRVQFVFSGTPEFYPPEYYSRKCYYQKYATSWSCGMILYVLLNGDLPFRDVRAIQHFHIHQTDLFHFVNDRQVKELLTGLLSPIPSERLSTEQLVKITNS